MLRRRAILLFLWFAAVALYSLWPVHNRTAILNTAGHDLANHVRHVYEAGLALREGQVPPLVCPRLEGGTRLPLFQYYSGTSYWAPAVWSLWDSNPYRALKVGVFLHVFAAGWGVYGVAWLIGRRGERQDAKTPSREEGDESKNEGRATGASLNSPGSGLSLASWRLGVHSSSVFWAALVAATAFQLAPFASADFYSRGSYTEFCALHAAPGVLYCALRAGRARGWRESVLWVCLCGLAVAYFVPLHPVQTMLCGALVALLAGVDAIERRRPLTPALSPEYRGEGGGVARSVAKLAGAAALGVAGSAWFWWPVLRDYGALRIVPHGAFLDAGLADPAVLLWPTYRVAQGYPWAPQLGFHFAAAAVLAVVFWKEARAVGVAAAVALGAVVCVVLFHEHWPAVGRVLAPLQWSYRLLVPGTVAGAVCLAVALGPVLRVAAAVDDRVGRAAVGAALAWVFLTSVPYFLWNPNWTRTFRVRNVVAPTWEAPNSTGSYALRGTDYRRLGFVRADGTLDTNVDLGVPPEGVPTEVEIVVRGSRARPAASAAGAPAAPGGKPLTPALSPEYGGEGGKRLEVWAGEGLPAPRGVGTSVGEGRVKLAFVLKPRVGHTPGDRVVRFFAPGDGGTAAAWRVEDVTFRALDDPAERICRVPGSVARRERGRETEFDVDVAAGREGWYQLPVYTLPSDGVTVNGRPADGTPSANRAMVMVRLGTGRNLVKIRTLPTRTAWGVSLVATLGMLVAAGASVATRPRVKG